MRRFLFGVVIASVTAAVPCTALGGDREIAKTVMTELQQYKEAGQLKGFDINLRVEEGTVFLTGEVATNEQRSLIARSAASAAGNQNVVNEIKVRSGESQGMRPSASQPVTPVEPEAVRPAPNIVPNVADSVPDTAITDSIYDALAAAKAAGTLRGFDLDISTVAGDVWIRGNVSTEQQKAMVIDVARRAQGVTRVIDDVTIASKGSVRSVSTELPSSVAVAATPMLVPKSITVPQSPSEPDTDYAPETAPVNYVPEAAPMNLAPETAPMNMAPEAEQVNYITEAAPQPAIGYVPQAAPMGYVPQAAPMGYVPQAAPMGYVPQAAPMGYVPQAVQAVPPQAVPPMGYVPQAVPQQMVQANMASYGGQVQSSGGPVPMHFAGAEYGMGAPRYDQPSLPNHAWPTYAAYPNYAAVTYPKQYSPSAWPYIGPFYPYPQVPLGWRKVSLQWDDGLWYLDFTGK